MNENKLICKICHQPYCDIKRLVIHIRTHNISSKCYYDKYFKKDNEGMCKTYGVETKFGGMKYGYLKHCNATCAQLNSEVRQRYKDKCIIKYGVENVFQLKEIKQKIKDTSMVKYGAEHHLKIKSQKDKVKNTCLKRYCVENVNQVKSVREKSKQTCLEKYGVEYSCQSDQMKDASKKTMVERYGAEHALQVPEFQQKFKDTCIEHLGVDSPLKSKEIQEKYKQTMLKNYGVDSPLKSKEIQEKFKQTCFEHFGVESSNQSENVKEKKKQTSLEHFGTDYPMQSEEVKGKLKQTCLNRFGETTNLKCKHIRDKIIQTCKKRYGVEYYFQTAQGRQCSRINAIRMVENQKLNGEPLYVKIGDQERPFLNELQKHICYNIIRNDIKFRYIVGRFPDGHILELKLFIQFDECHHFLDKECTQYREDDIQCTKDLESIPEYRVFRVSEKRWKENKEDVINEFKQLLKKE